MKFHLRRRRDKWNRDSSGVGENMRKVERELPNDEMSTTNDMMMGKVQQVNSDYRR